MRGRGDGVVLAGLAATLAFGGCSFALVYGPPPLEQWPSEQTRQVEDLAHCTTSPAAPIIDGTLTVGFLTGAVYLATQQDFLGFNQVAAGVLLVPGLVYLASSVYGIAQTRACRTYLAGPPYPGARALPLPASP